MKILVMLLALSLVSVGCASQKSVDDLNSRVSKLESKRAENKAALESALDSAESQRLRCRADAEQKFNNWLDNNGTPVKGKQGVYHADREGLKQAHDDEYREDGDCQREYENAVQTAKLRYSE